LNLKDITKKYTNGEVTILWKPSLCAHSGNCFRGLPEVFKPAERPWITPEGATTEKMISQVKQCPSGALSYIMNSSDSNPVEENKPATTEIEVRPGGPLFIKGSFTIRHKDGTIETRERNTSFCRCGHSNNKPFCDGTHRSIEFDTPTRPSPEEG
jgi:uncharacterized Fe-S cluster protein YjdI/CDGSH-type Zn-finger protein